MSESARFDGRLIVLVNTAEPETAIAQALARVPEDLTALEMAFEIASTSCTVLSSRAYIQPYHWICFFSKQFQNTPPNPFLCQWFSETSYSCF